MSSDDIIKGGDRMTTRYVDWPNNLTRSELVGLLRSFATEARDIEHILAIALGFAIDHDGEVGPAGMPAIGDNTALTLAMAAAKRLGEIDAELDQCNAKERAAGLRPNHPTNGSGAMRSPMPDSDPGEINSKELVEERVQRLFKLHYPYPSAPPSRSQVRATIRALSVLMRGSEYRPIVLAALGLDEEPTAEHDA